MAEKSSECLSGIIKKIQDNTRFFNCTTGWYNFKFLSEDFLKFIANATIQEIKKSVNKANVKPKSTKENKTQITLGKGTIRSEELIERLICLTNENNNKILSCKNQIPIKDKNNPSHIDLVVENDNYINLIELKQWDNSKNPPTYAIVECIKNLYALDENIKLNKNIILTVLAPAEYYYQFIEPIGKKRMISNATLVNWENYFKFLEILETLLSVDFNNIQIEIKYINFSENVCNQFKNELPQGTITLSECYNKPAIYHSKIKANLKLENWKEITKSKLKDNLNDIVKLSTSSFDIV